MREIEFKMERSGLLNEGDILPVTEYALPNALYYVLGRSYAMSGNIPKHMPLKNKSGKVAKIEETPRGFYVTVEFDEEQ